MPWVCRKHASLTGAAVTCGWQVAGLIVTIEGFSLHHKLRDLITPAEGIKEIFVNTNREIPEPSEMAGSHLSFRSPVAENTG